MTGMLAFFSSLVLCGIMAVPILARDAVDNDWETDWPTCQRVILNGPDRDRPGTPVAQYCEGLRSLFGQPGVAGDSLSASRWFRRAAKQNHPGAQTALGYMYEEGTGVPRNPVTALWWYRKAAAQGNPTALFKVGHAYELGIGTAKDEVKAGEYYRQAAHGGSEDAKKVLAFWRERFCCAQSPQNRR